MSAPLIILALDVATIVCAVLLAGRVLASQPRAPSAQLVAAIALATACGVLLGHQDYGPWMPSAFRIDVGVWAGALNIARNLTSGLLMLLCFTLFTDRRRFPRWLLALFAVQLVLEEPGRALIPAAWRYARLTTQTAPALLQALFAGLALYWTVADWRADLIERRRRTRLLTLVVAGLLTLVSGLLTRVVIDPDSRANYLAHLALTAADLVIFTFILFQLTEVDVSRDLAFEPAAPARPRPAAEADAGAPLARLTALLGTEQVWQEEGLSLKTLADRTGLPEYRLRKLIHEQLGYRNFNALLHDHRVREACRQLRDPDLRRTPILTIALSVGYASVNTFNRGFREIMGVTPSAWRAAAHGANAEAAPEPE
ncbi:MAG: helix-turn-helix transcriptional regulator [Proteobacteria bacterium]|nr:helix-turn-helix transcriptional regulator [Pseudomonadota bacterium]